MARYKINDAPIGGWIDTITNQSIPPDIDNTDCQRVLKWIEEGNVPESTDEQQNQPLTSRKKKTL